MHRTKVPNVSSVLFFGVAGKGKIAGVGQQLFALAHGVDLVLIIHIRIGHDGGQRQIHLAGGLAVLAGMGLVDDDGKMAVLVVFADIGQDKRKLSIVGG